MSHPALVLAVLWLVMLGLDRLARRAGRSTPDWARALLPATSCALLAAFVIIVLWYGVQLTYFDPAEPTITAVASVFGAGGPLYPAIDAPERYAHIYGPVLFIVHAAALGALGPGILASKAAGAIAILASLAIGFHILRERAGASAALVATAACALVYMAFGNVTFWTRSDPLLILTVTCGLLTARLRSRAASIVLLGMSVGVAVNLKVTGPLYLLPVAAIALAAHGGRALIGAAAVAAVCAMGPFVLPNVSLTNYLDYLELSASQGLAGGRVRQNLEWAVFLCAPVFGVLSSARLIARSRGRAEVSAGALAAAVLVISVAAAKPGGGPFHLLPFVPVLAYVVVSAGPHARGAPWTRSLVIAFGITALLIAVPRQLIFVRTMAGRDLGPAASYLREFAAAHPGRRIEVGYAGTSYLSYARPEIVFRTREYLLDAPAIQEHRLAGLQLPASTLQALDTCRIEYMLIPTGADPFVVPSAYFPHGPADVFPEAFRATFHRRYRRITSGELFDVWECSDSFTGGSLTKVHSRGSLTEVHSHGSWSWRPGILPSGSV